MPRTSGCAPRWRNSVDGSTRPGQGVVWYTGQFYTLTFMMTSLKLPWQTAYTLLSIALLVTTPLFIYCGALSDRVGRKRLILGGCLLGALTYVPIFVAMKHLSADLSGARYLAMVGLLIVQMIYVCMVYGPIAAFLVELFPTKIRYTSMSLPYHIGNGWFGGFLPLIATFVTTSEWARRTFGAGAIYSGLIYPIVICLVTLFVGMRYIRETHSNRLAG